MEINIKGDSLTGWSVSVNQGEEQHFNDWDRLINTLDAIKRESDRQMEAAA